MQKISRNTPAADVLPAPSPDSGDGLVAAAGNTLPNTAIVYLYRDASNYKVGGRAVVAGRMDEADIAAIQSSLFDGAGFVPGQIGLQDLQDQFDTETPVWGEDDHPFHELLAIEPTDKAPTIFEADGPSGQDGATASPAPLAAATLARRFASVQWDFSYEPSFAEPMRVGAWQPGSTGPRHQIPSPD